MKNVLHICNYAAPYRGNFISSLEFLAEKLNEQDVEQVYLLPRRAAESGALKWIEELRAAGRNVYLQEASPVKNLRLLKKILKAHSIKTVFCHFSDGKTDALLRIAGRRQNVVRFFHGMFDVDANSPKLPLYRFLWKNNTFVCVSKAVQDDLRPKFPSFDIHTIENAICFSRLDEADAFEKPNSTVCAVMGYNFRIKGVDLALAAVSKLRERYELTLLIPAASHSEELRRCIIETLGEIPSWVKILPPTERIATYYRNTDVFLSPSRTEGFCYAIPEAAYCGAAVVASDIPSQSEFKIPGIYYFNQGSAEALEDALEHAVCELDQNAAQRSAAKAAAVKEYDLSVWADRVITLLGGM